MDKMPDLNALMKQAQQMQEQMQKAQEELASQTFEGSAGGGAVTATATGEGTLTAVALDPSVIDSDDPELLGDLVVAAVNQALQAARDAAGAAVGEASGLGNLDLGGLDLGGLLGG